MHINRGPIKACICMWQWLLIHDITRLLCPFIVHTAMQLYTQLEYVHVNCFAQSLSPSGSVQVLDSYVNGRPTFHHL